MPLRTHYSEGGADSDRQGLGDIKLATGTAFRLGKKWRAAARAEMRCPSASSELGNNAWRLQLFGTVAWYTAPWLTFSLSLEYNKSVDEVRGSKPQKFLEMFLLATFILPERWSVTARYEAKVDYEKNDFWTHSVKFVIAKQLEQLPLGFSLSLKKQFVGAEKEFQINFVSTYYFRSQKH